MTLEEAVFARHSVRAYTGEPIAEDAAAVLKEETEACNREGGLAIRLVQNESKAFKSFLARYGKFSGVTSYFAIAGEQADDLQERAGYYGERLVLKAQALGLNTCWAALTFGKGAVKKAACLKKGEKLVCVIAVGYGKTQGAARKSKTFDDVAVAKDAPDWFKKGVEFALLAPTATNQQKFRFILEGDTVRAESTGGFYDKIDLGIVKYHFETGSGRKLR